MNPPTSTVLIELGRISLQAGLLALIVLGVQLLLRRRLSPRWRCALWWLVVLRLLLPFSPKSSFSIFNALPALAAAQTPAKLVSPPVARAPVQATAKPPVESPRSAQVSPAGDSAERTQPFNFQPVRSESASVPVARESMRPVDDTATRPGTSASPARQPPPPSASWLRTSTVWPVLGGIWCVGMLFLGAQVVGSMVRMRRRLSGLEPLTGAEVLERLKECREQMNVHVPLRIFETAAVTSPALYGFLHPRLLLPRGFTSEFSVEEQRFVFLHELAHVKRRDLMLNWLLTLLQIVHWFNPLVWLAFARFRADRELACDALVLSRAGAASSEAYGRTVLRLVQSFTRPSAVPGMVGILEDKRQLRHRIAAIAEFTPATRGAGLAVALLLVLGALALTDAKESEPEKEKTLPPVIPLSLTNLLVSAEDGEWHTDKPWLDLPRGTQDFGGIEFHVDGLLHLQGVGTQDAKKEYRSRIVVPLTETNVVDKKTVVLQHGSNVGTLHLIGGTRFGADGGTRFADVVWRYNDGTSRRTSLQYGVHLRDWYRTPYEEPARLPYQFTKAIWWGPHADPNRPGRTKRLYRLSLTNPEPAKIVRQVEFASIMAQPSLFFVALTLDPLKPGERPDNSPDLEQVDPPLTGRLQLTVQDSDARPLAGAQVTAAIRRSGEQADGFRKTFKTDTNGLAEVQLPGDRLERVALSASKEDYGGRKMIWDLKAGDTIPSEYTFKLTSGIKISGSVVDSDDKPIPGASVTINRFWSGGDRMLNQGEEAEFATQKTTSDAEGKWTARNLPPELLANIMLQASHPDYIATNVTVGASSKDTQYKLVLRRGLEVRGRVTDDQDQPIAGATVWTGKRYFRERQQTQTDGQGRFTFRNVNEGEVLFSVIAKGRKADNKTYTVSAGMDEIVFRLGPGNAIRARVQNEAGEPVPGTRLMLDGGPGQSSYEAYEYSGTTDQDGRFEWNGAPDEPMTFYIAHPDYVQKRNVRLDVNKDNVVTLRRTGKVQGVVVDATTEQPITKFSMGLGRSFHDDNFYPSFPGMREYTSPSGQFTIDVKEEENNTVMVQATDYAEQTQRLPSGQSGDVQMVFRLKPDAGLKGVVTMADGRPAPGVSVAVPTGTPGSQLQLARRSLKSFNSMSASKLAITDSTGHFNIPSPPVNGTVVAIGPAGAGSAPVAQVREQGVVVLQAYGRIEGVFKLGGVPVAGQEFTYNLSSGISVDFSAYKSVTDAEGRFAFEDIPPGEGGIVRLVQTQPNMWTHSHLTDVTVEPGQTTHVTVGESGGVVRGQVRLDLPAEESEGLVLSARLSSPPPKYPEGLTPEQSRAFMLSPEGRGLMKQMKSYSARVNADGSLVLDSIPPGTYKLAVTAVKPTKGENYSFNYTPPAATSDEVTVIIPEYANPSDPIQVGEIVLRPPKPTQPGAVPFP